MNRAFLFFLYFLVFIAAPCNFREERSFFREEKVLPHLTVIASQDAKDNTCYLLQLKNVIFKSTIASWKIPLRNFSFRNNSTSRYLKFPPFLFNINASQDVLGANFFAKGFHLVLSLLPEASPNPSKHPISPRAPPR